VTGSILLATTEPGWLSIPEELPAAEREAWLERCIGEFQAAWGDLWTAEAEQRMRQMLLAGLDERPDAELVFEVWPVFRTVRVRVQIDMFASATLPDWQGDGFSVLAYEDAPIGPGIMCVRMHDLGTGDDVEATLVDWCAVFDDGERALVVLVESTLPHLFGQILPGLHGMISTLQVTLPDGAPFAAASPAAVLIDDDAMWMSLQLEAERRAAEEASAPDERGEAG
jgi:hypothetical protein